MSGRKNSIGQVRSLMSAFVDHMPDDMDFDLMQEWVNDLHKVLPVILRNYKPLDVLAVLKRDLQTPSSSSEIIISVNPQLVVPPTYPANNEKFELTVDWQTKWFMLVNVGYQPNWQALQDALTPHGSATGESERTAFKKKFPRADGRGPIGFAKIPLGYAHFPSVSTDGDLYFYWAVNDFNAFWRWLVEVQAV